MDNENGDNKETTTTGCIQKASWESGDNRAQPKMTCARHAGRIRAFKPIMREITWLFLRAKQVLENKIYGNSQNW